jgi:hypothetical protein
LKLLSRHCEERLLRRSNLFHRWQGPLMGPGIAAHAQRFALVGRAARRRKMRSQ